MKEDWLEEVIIRGKFKEYEGSHKVEMGIPFQTVGTSCLKALVERT